VGSCGGDGRGSDRCAPYDSEMAKLSLHHNKRYEAGCNIWSIDVQFSPNPGVPFSQKNLQKLVDHVFGVIGALLRCMIHLGGVATYLPNQICMSMP
jgi:hypothetical protein